MSEITIKTILDEMKDTVVQGKTKSAGWWVDKGIELASLWSDLKDEMNRYEMMYKNEISKLIEQGKKVSEAERITEGISESYKMYLYLKGRDEIIQEFIRLAKVRAKVNEYETL